MESERGPRPADGHLPARARATSARGEAARLQLVEPAIRRCPAGPGRRRPRRWRRLAGWDGLAAQQRDYLDRFWERSDVEIEGDPALQQAVRVSMFHVLQAGARTESQAIPAKGLTGPGYDGHAFWDTETFALPMLTYTAPGGRQGCAHLAPRDPADGDGARGGARPRRRRVPVADHSRRGVLGLLAGRHSRVPRQRRHRRCHQPVRRRDRRRGVRQHASGSICWSRRRGSGRPWATSPARTASGSTGSPAPTSTPL